MRKSVAAVIGMTVMLASCDTDKAMVTSGSPLPGSKYTTEAVNGMLTTDIATNANYCRPFSKGAPYEDEDEYYLNLAAIYHRPTQADVGSNFLIYPASYDDQSRTLVERVFVGKQSLATLTATVSFGDVQIGTISMFSSQHNSDTDKGETFKDNQDVWNTGLIVRVAKDKTFHIAFDANYATTIEQMSLISSGLQLAETGISTFVPGAHFLSELDKPSLAKQAKLYDAAIGKALGKATGTKAVIEIKPADIAADACGAIRLTIPGTERLNPRFVVGDWYFGIRQHRKSLFASDAWVASGPYLLARDNKEVSPQRILDESVGGEPEQRLAKFALADSTVSGAVTDLKTAITAKNPLDQQAAGISFCANVKSVLHGVGLTTIDAKLGLWALLEGVGTSLPGKLGVNDLAALKLACGDELKPIELPATETVVVAPKPAAKPKAPAPAPKKQEEPSK